MKKTGQALKKFEQLMESVKNLSEEETRAVREGLSEEQLAVFDLLKKPELSARERKKIKEIAVVLPDTLKAEPLRVDKRREKRASAAEAESYIYDYLFASLPVEYSDAESGEKAEFVFSHIYQQYPEIYDSVYAAI